MQNFATSLSPQNLESTNSPDTLVTLDASFVFTKEPPSTSNYVVPVSNDPEISSSIASGGSPLTTAGKAIVGDSPQLFKDKVLDHFSDTAGEQGFFLRPIHGRIYQTEEHSIKPPSPRKETIPTVVPRTPTSPTPIIPLPRVTDLSLYSAGPSDSGTTFRRTEDSPATRVTRPEFKMTITNEGSTESTSFANTTAVDSIDKDPSPSKAKLEYSLKRKSMLQDLNKSMANIVNPKVENIIKKPKKEKKETKGRPPNPYILYFNDNQGRIKKNNEKLNYKEISKIAAAEWKTLKEENQEKFLEYQDRYKESMIVYRTTKDAVKENDNENKRLSPENKDLKLENRQLKDQKQKILAENIELKRQHNDLEKNIKHLQTENSNLQKEKDDLTTAYNQTKDVVDKLLKN